MESPDNLVSDTIEQERSLVQALRLGDEAAFMALVEQYNASMLRISQVYVADRAAAEEVVQETWLGVLQGIQRFEGRSSLKTWLFRILVNQASKRAKRDRRTIPFSDLESDQGDGEQPAVDPGRFIPFGEPGKAGHWAQPPTPWQRIPEEQVLSSELQGVIQRALESLPAKQRLVFSAGDIEGWSAQEICNVFDLTDTNQRVLLHRARARLRQFLEDYWNADRTP